MRKLLFLVPAIIIVGCSSKPTLVGEWSATPEGSPQAQTFTFESGNKVKMASNMMGQNFILHGDYKEEAASLSITPQKLETPGLDASLQKQVDSAFAAQKGKPMSFSLKWISADEAELTPTTNANPAVPSTKVVMKRTKK
ncbi:MAG TPA: hypothetical protein PKA27_11570 [Fimbriimonadaceae bacterium]|nr:hypothetical protein [Fimbriimonadaceae bacterium]